MNKTSRVIEFEGRRAKISGSSRRYVAVHAVGQKRLEILTSRDTAEEALKMGLQLGAADAFVIDSEA